MRMRFVIGTGSLLSYSGWPYGLFGARWWDRKPREVLASLGLKPITLAPLHRIEDGINAVRMFLRRCRFDAKKCTRGLDALKLYRADYDDKLMALRAHPVHDWISRAADSFRYLAMTLDGREVRGFYRRIEYAREGVV